MKNRRKSYPIRQCRWLIFRTESSREFTSLTGLDRNTNLISWFKKGSARGCVYITHERINTVCMYNRIGSNGREILGVNRLYVIGPFQSVSNIDVLSAQTTGPSCAVLVCSKKVIGYNYVVTLHT